MTSGQKDVRSKEAEGKGGPDEPGTLPGPEDGQQLPRRQPGPLPRRRTSPGPADEPGALSGAADSPEPLPSPAGEPATRPGPADGPEPPLDPVDEPEARPGRAEAPRARPSLEERRRGLPAGRPSRRRVVLAGIGAVAGVAGVTAAAGGAVYAGWLPGRSRLIRAVEGCGEPGAVPAVEPGPVSVTSFRSAARRRQVDLVVAYPPGYEPRAATDDEAPGGAPGGDDAAGDDAGLTLPVCLVLHGRGDTARGLVGPLAAQAFLAAAAATGVAPFALAAVDGGETYWHRRADGDDPETMLLGEVLPRLAAQGLSTDRFAAYGWSMGGYGALLLARRHPTRVVAVAASSPAVWHSYGDAASGAFDSAADFDDHRVLGVGPARGVAYRIDCGNADPFSRVDHTLAAELAAAERGFPVGCHDFGFWRRQLPAQLAFLGRALST
ncbi:MULTISPECIES: alpha/beta hydrolase-fold protein [Pseudofrankia]|uniref:alpha/beta hydrolase-fold protein n=1 Tax=Pseudofrankia TaxID=2994363 RepID=UPI0009F529B4